MKISRKERKENRKKRKGLNINSLRTLPDPAFRSAVQECGQAGLRKKTLRPMRETFFPKYLNIYIINCLSSYKSLYKT
jgi:hypothetical protein